MNLAIAVQKAAAARVKSVVIFQDDDRFLNRIERRASALEHAPARSQRVAHAANMGADHVIGHGPRATMNYENGIHKNFLNWTLRLDSGCDSLV